MTKLTAADDEAFGIMPTGRWFSSGSLPLRRSRYRCNRLVGLGLLETRGGSERPECRKIKNESFCVSPKRATAEFCAATGHTSASMQLLIAETLAGGDIEF